MVALGYLSHLEPMTPKGVLAYRLQKETLVFPGHLNEVVGCGAARVILHLLEPSKNQPRGMHGDSGLPMDGSFHAITPASLEEEDTIFLLYGWVGGCLTARSRKKLYMQSVVPVLS